MREAHHQNSLLSLNWARQYCNENLEAEEACNTYWAVACNMDCTWHCNTRSSYKDSYLADCVSFWRLEWVLRWVRLHLRLANLLLL